MDICILIIALKGVVIQEYLAIYSVKKICSTGKSSWLGNLRSYKTEQTTVFLQEGHGIRGFLRKIRRNPRNNVRRLARVLALTFNQMVFAQSIWRQTTVLILITIEASSMRKNVLFIEPNGVCSLI